MPRKKLSAGERKKRRQATTRGYYQRNKEDIRSQQKEYWEENKVELKKSHAKYYQKNKNTILVKRKSKRLANALRRQQEGECTT